MSLDTWLPYKLPLSSTLFSTETRMENFASLGKKYRENTERGCSVVEAQDIHTAWHHHPTQKQCSGLGDFIQRKPSCMQLAPGCVCTKTGSTLTASTKGHLVWLWECGHPQKQLFFFTFLSLNVIFSRSNIRNKARHKACLHLLQALTIYIYLR